MRYPEPLSPAVFTPIEMTAFSHSALSEEQPQEIRTTLHGHLRHVESLADLDNDLQLPGATREMAMRHIVASLDWMHGTYDFSETERKDGDVDTSEGAELGYGHWGTWNFRRELPSPRHAADVTLDTTVMVHSALGIDLLPPVEARTAVQLLSQDVPGRRVPDAVPLRVSEATLFGVAGRPKGVLRRSYTYAEPEQRQRLRAGYGMWLLGRADISVFGSVVARATYNGEPVLDTSVMELRLEDVMCRTDTSRLSEVMGRAAAFARLMQQSEVVPPA